MLLDGCWAIGAALAPPSSGDSNLLMSMLLSYMECTALQVLIIGRGVQWCAHIAPSAAGSRAYSAFQVVATANFKMQQQGGSKGAQRKR
jgi:hypothetical protein